MTRLATSTETAQTVRAARSRVAVQVGRVLSVAVGAFLLFDGVTHVLRIKEVEDSFTALGFPAGAALGIGLLELLCLALYAVPRTRLLGALLLTAYLGGAFCAQLRVGAPLFSTLLFGVYLGVALWVGLYLTDERLRQFAPWAPRTTEK
jgi:hypothetical protein